jgi:multisubunit Na+/H+ antiporter MnhB subunit
MSRSASTNEDQTDHEPSELSALAGDLEKTLTSLPKDAKAVLQVIDAKYDGSKPAARAEFSLDTLDEIEDGLKSLIPHAQGCARILNVTVHSDFIITGLRDTRGPKTTQPTREVLLNWLQDTYAQPNIKSLPFEERRIFRWLSDPLLVNDIGSISSQWTQCLDVNDTSLYRLVNRTSLQQHPLDYDVQPRDSYLTCAKVGNDRLIGMQYTLKPEIIINEGAAIIVNDVWSSQSFQTNKSGEDAIDFKNPRCITNMENQTSLTSMTDGTLETFAKLLVLDFFLDSVYMQKVDYYGPLIYPQLDKDDVVKFSLRKNPHLQVPLGLFEPRLNAKSKEAFKEIEDAEGILRSVDNLVDSIKYVENSLSPQTIRGLQYKKKSSFESHDACYKLPELRVLDLQGLYKEPQQNAKRALDALERQLEYLTKRHAISEAKSIRVLTILAAIYLPLSLAASVLGMQSPFKKIAHNMTQANLDGDEAYLVDTNLLFDFFGIFVGLSAITVFIVYGIRFSLWIKLNWLGYLSKHFKGPYSILHYGRRWKFGGRGGRYFDVLRVITAWWLGAIFAVTLITLFMIGMLDEAQAAWDVAWIMFVIYGAVGAALLGLYWALYKHLYRKRLRV